MVDENYLIDNKYWIHWQLTSKEWNDFAKIRLEEEKEDMLSNFLGTFILCIILAIFGFGFEIALVLYFFTALIIWFRFKSNRSNYALSQTTVDIYIGSKGSSINAFINGISYSYDKDILRMVSFESYSQDIKSINLYFSTLGTRSSKFYIYFPVPKRKQEEAKIIFDKLRNIREANLF